MWFWERQLCDNMDIQLVGKQTEDKESKDKANSMAWKGHCEADSGSDLDGNIGMAMDTDSKYQETALTDVSA